MFIFLRISANQLERCEKIKKRRSAITKGITILRVIESRYTVRAIRMAPKPIDIILFMLLGLDLVGCS